MEKVYKLKIWILPEEIGNGEISVKQLKTMMVFGTRPDAIKMMPLVYACRKRPEIDLSVCVTAQHRELLDDVLFRFHVQPQYDLNIMRLRQTLTEITTRVLTGLASVFEQAKPDVVLVHGDTTTGLAAGLSAFYHQIPVGHVEAGLRTGNPYSPFPEEMNRTILGDLCSVHFAPTEQNRQNLLDRHVSGKIYVTGNTAIDVLRYTVSETYVFSQPVLNTIDYRQKVILLTSHRRENLDGGLSEIFSAVHMLLEAFSDISFLFPVHPNPVVRRQAQTAFQGNKRVCMLEPLDVFDMHNLMNRCYFVMTDSGGIQEEAPALHKPVLVLRRETERIEAVLAGTAVLAGVERNEIFTCASRLLREPLAYQKMSLAKNPFGDGYASERIVDALVKIV
ncbi:MAG: UDP-N-acetylglucosamine 2-epimerase (non-hydrolyzing) [Ruminococcaceae bacterium]|nr:UDP-N-acetylglucosamine 2-epimerase (non-hydrolyzing) [Oscillospiraceae bacterium]